jgi:hypothetical protein
LSRSGADQLNHGGATRNQGFPHGLAEHSGGAGKEKAGCEGR